MSISKIQRVPLRAVWPHEARDFTTWLAENIDVLNEIIFPTLSAVEREQSAGAFSVDLVAQDQSGSTVVIENQLEKSDHDHLGKLLTYLAAFEATTAVWIVSEPRTEHASAINWLNESSSADFYLIKVEAITIGDSSPAPLLTQIVGPSEAGKAVAQQKQELSELNHRYLDFWSGLLKHANGRTKLHSGNSPSKAHYLAASAGVPGCFYTYVVLKEAFRIELYIDVGDTEYNKHVFDLLKAKSLDIDSAFASPLDWQRMESSKGCRIAHHNKNGGWATPREQWPSIFTEMVDDMIRLEYALRQPLMEVQ